MTSSLITSRDPKGLDFMRKTEDKYNKAKLDEERAQRLNENPEFWAALGHLIVQHSLTNQFADEEVSSTWTYPEGYASKPIIEQIETLRKYFPELSVDLTIQFVSEVMPNIPLSDDEPFWFWSAFPRWEKIGATYNEAVERILKVLASTRSFYNYRAGNMGSQYLQQQERSIIMYDQLKAQQAGDILIVQSQFGLRHRGRSTRRAIEVFHHNEVGHGWCSGAAMMLTHPEREVRWEQLHTDLPGDKFAPDGDGRFSGAPIFGCSDGQLKTGTGGVGVAGDRYGSASWLLQQ